MQVWLGIGNHEIQIDLPGSGLKLCLPKPGTLHQDGCAILPSADCETLWEFDIHPIDRGYEDDSSRSWYYLASYLWEDPNTRVTAACETKVVLCRDANASWGICIYPEPGASLLLSLPVDLAQDMETVFASHPLPRAFIPRVIPGGEGGG